MQITLAEGFGKGKINYQEDLAWMKGQPPFGSKGKFGKGKFGNQKGKTSGKGKDLHFSDDHSLYPVFSADGEDAELKPHEPVGSIET